MHSLKMIQTRQTLLVLLLVLAGVCAQLSQAEQSNKDVEEQQVVAPSTTRTGKLLVPEGLTRFFFYNTRANERQSQAGGSPVGGYKRSSSALDALTGVTLGKRSAPVDLINFAAGDQPALYGAASGGGGRLLPSAMRPTSASRLYEPRWLVPSFEALEAPLDYYN